MEARQSNLSRPDLNRSSRIQLRNTNRCTNRTPSKPSSVSRRGEGSGTSQLSTSPPVATPKQCTVGWICKRTSFEGTTHLLASRNSWHMVLGGPPILPDDQTLEELCYEQTKGCKLTPKISLTTTAKWRKEADGCYEHLLGPVIWHLEQTRRRAMRAAPSQGITLQAAPTPFGTEEKPATSK